jgi:hypothetical protein
MNLKQFRSLGGKARARRLTPEQRSESARKAANARWAKIENLESKKAKTRLI